MVLAEGFTADQMEDQVTRKRTRCRPG